MSLSAKRAVREHDLRVVEGRRGERLDVLLAVGDHLAGDAADREVDTEFADIAQRDAEVADRDLVLFFDPVRAIAEVEAERVDADAGQRLLKILVRHERDGNDEIADVGAGAGREAGDVAGKVEARAFESARRAHCRT